MCEQCGPTWNMCGGCMHKLEFSLTHPDPWLTIMVHWAQTVVRVQSTRGEGGREGLLSPQHDYHLQWKIAEI